MDFPSVKSNLFRGSDETPCFGGDEFRSYAERQPFIALPPSFASTRPEELAKFDLLTGRRIIKSLIRVEPRPYFRPALGTFERFKAYDPFDFYYVSMPPDIAARTGLWLFNPKTENPSRFHEAFVSLKIPKRLDDSDEIRHLVNWCQNFGPPCQSPSGYDWPRLYLDDFVGQIELLRWVIRLKNAINESLQSDAFDALVDEIERHQAAIELLTGKPSRHLLSSDIVRYCHKRLLNKKSGRLRSPAICPSDANAPGKRSGSAMRRSAAEEAQEILDNIFSGALRGLDIYPEKGALSVRLPDPIGYIYFMFLLDWNLGKFLRKCANKSCPVYFVPSREDKVFCSSECNATSHGLDQTKFRTIARALFRAGLSDEAIVAEVLRMAPSRKTTTSTVQRWTEPIRSKGALLDRAKIIHWLLKAGFSSEDIQRLKGYSAHEIENASRK